MSCCKEIEEQLSLFQAEELESKLRGTVEEHLAECADCRQKLLFLKGFQAKVSEAETPQYPSEVHNRLLAALEKEKSEKVVPLSSGRAPQKKSRSLLRYLAAAAVLCVCGLGVIQAQYGSNTPDAVASLVDHHDTCWHIQPSAGRDAQFDEWVEKLGKMPPTPEVSQELVAFDQRECPAGEVRAGHLMYHKGEQKLSVYILPADDFLKSYGGELQEHTHNGREIVLERKGDWVYGVVAKLPPEEIKRLVDTEHVAMLEQFLAQRQNSEMKV